MPDQPYVHDPDLRLQALEHLRKHTGPQDWYGCNLFDGEQDRNGNAYLLLSGVISMPAHHFVWELMHNAPVLKTQKIVRTCGHPLCVAPAHLKSVNSLRETVDGADEYSSDPRVQRARDILEGYERKRTRVLKGGTRHISPELARLLRDSPDNVATLARRYGVSRMTIYNIRNGKTWKHLL